MDPLKRSAVGFLRAPSKLASQALLPCSSYRCFSVLNRPPPNYEGHVPLTRTERLGLAIGSGLSSFLDPRRGGVLSVTRIMVTESDLHRSDCGIRRGYSPTILHPSTT